MWHKAALTEFEGLTNMGVFDHDYSWDELGKVGIDTKIKHPLPLSVICDHKYDKEGILDRLKVRMAIAGHPGNMQRGVHYDQTFAATPGQHSSRILQAIMVRNKYKRLAWDIKQAYCWAEVASNELFAVKYPKGFERYEVVDGVKKPLYMVVRRNLYGHPGAARAWSKARDEFILNRFNEKGWTCTRCLADPTLFNITFTGCSSDGKNMDESEYPKGVTPGNEAILLIHTDDCDCVGDNDEILKFIADAMHERWEIKVTDSDFMLGVKRTLIDNESEFSVELTMTAYIDGMCKAFNEFDKPKHVNTPFPEHAAGNLSKNDPADEDETKRVLDRGYMRLVGMLLWASRNVNVECAYGTSMLCRVMSCPSEKAWKAGMHMLQWLHQNRLNGIKFSHDGNDKPIAFSDSSFHHGVKEHGKLKPNDCKDQYGWVIIWQGGPIAYVSKRHKHVGFSTCHVEYMVMSECYKNIIYMRQLLDELRVENVTDYSTILFGDNQAANSLTEYDFVSSNNQYVLTSYHAIKEGTALGLIDVRYKKSRLNLSDLLTKNVSSGEIKNLIDTLRGYVLNDLMKNE